MVFFRPSYLRSHLLALLTADPLAGPHTALVLLPHGQVLAAVSTTSVGWEEGAGTVEDGVSGLDLDGNGQEEQGDDDDDDEPYMETAERNRLLLGLASSQWAEAGSHTEGVKVECELGRILLHPFSIPIPPTALPAFGGTHQSHHRASSLPNPNNASAVAEKGQETETVLLAVNGIKGIKWERLEAKVRQFASECQLGAKMKAT